MVYRRVATDVSEAWECMRYRMELKFNLDCRQRDIFIIANNLCDNEKLIVTFNADEDEAKELWLKKYKTIMPENAEYYRPYFFPPIELPGVGLRALSQKEKIVLKRLYFDSDFFIDSLWLLVDGLGWTLGKPVEEDDIGWLAIWAEDEFRLNYVNTVRDALGMKMIDYYWEECGVHTVYLHREMPTGIRKALNKFRNSKFGEIPFIPRYPYKPEEPAKERVGRIP